jgi:hypothetical protein
MRGYTRVDLRVDLRVGLWDVPVRMVIFACVGIGSNAHTYVEY